MRVTTETVRGRRRHVVDYGTFQGRRVRRYYWSAADAGKAAKRATAEARSSGIAWASRPEQERAQVLGILAEMDREGVRLADVWAAWQAGQLGPAPNMERTLGQAIEETITAKRQANRTPRYVRALADYLRKFALGREATPVHSITPADIEEWFADHPQAPSTRVANTGRLSAMFSLCVRRGYCRDNPCRRLERVTVEARAPLVLTVDQCRAALEYARTEAPDVLGYLVLCLFAGVRPEEAQALSWSAVDLRAKTARLDKTKVRQRRIVELPDNAAAWLAVCPHRVGPVVRGLAAMRRARRRLRDHLGIPWPQDVLRHTAASYLLALRKNAYEVADMLGNSPRMLLRHYKNLVNQEDAEAWKNLMPE